MREVWKLKGEVSIYVNVLRTTTMFAGSEMYMYALNIPSEGPLVIAAGHHIQQLVRLDLLTDIPLCYTHVQR